MDITLVVSLDQAEMLWSLLADARGAHVNDPQIESEIATLQGIVNEAIEAERAPPRDDSVRSAARDMKAGLPTLDEVRGILKPGDEHR